MRRYVIRMATKRIGGPLFLTFLVTGCGHVATVSDAGPPPAGDDGSDAAIVVDASLAQDAGSDVATDAGNDATTAPTTGDDAAIDAAADGALESEAAADAIGDATETIDAGAAAGADAEAEAEAGSNAGPIVLFGGDGNGTSTGCCSSALGDYHSMATLGDKVVLFGGSVLATPGNVADTWLWDGATWTQANVSGPPARSTHAMSGPGGPACGPCPTGQLCSSSGACVACVPDCTGKTCGADGCGGSCGACPSGDNCVNGQCTPCVPMSCAELGMTCGGGSDGCGEIIDCGPCQCGTCATGLHCNTGIGVCEGPCMPATCAQLGLTCGITNDGCTANINCGSCMTGQRCVNGHCAAM